MQTIRSILARSIGLIRSTGAKRLTDLAAREVIDNGACFSVARERERGRRKIVGITKVSLRFFVFERTDYSDVLYGCGRTKESARMGRRRLAARTAIMRPAGSLLNLPVR